MRVLHFVKSSVGARWALAQMRRLGMLGVDVHVALPPGGPLWPQYEAAGIVTHPLQTDIPARRPWRLPGLLARVRHLVGDVSPDLIHSHSVGTTLTTRLALGKDHPVARVFQVPGPLHLEHPFFREGEIATAGRADSWIGSCVATCRRYVQAGVPPRRVFLSRYGMELEEPPSSPGTDLRADLRIPRSLPIVGMVAYMYAPRRYLGQTRGLKGHEDLIDAMARGIEAACVFVGGAWGGADAYEREVVAYGTRRLGRRAFFLGTRKDVADLYRGIDVAVHPSHSENTGGAPESLLAGVPTIATNVGGFPDIVIDGETGWLVPPRRPDLLADRILSVLRDLEGARRLAGRGRSKAREMFDVRATSKEVLGIYERILGRRFRGA